MNRTEFPGYLKRSGFLEGILVLILIASGILGWGWLMRVTVERIDVRGATNATYEDVLDLASVDSGAVMFKLRGNVIEERLRRHPWIRRAGITRMPTGSLIISVTERSPVLQTIETNGRPGFYLDEEGYPMHPTARAAYDVPVYWGYPDQFHPTEPASHQPTLDMLAAVAINKGRAEILISEVVFEDDEYWLWLEPSGRHQSMPVRLGSSDLPEKFERLAAFWKNRVAVAHDRKFELIDLRFSSQIISREEERETPDLPVDP